MPNLYTRSNTRFAFLLHSEKVSSLGCRSVKKEEDGNIAAPPLPPFMAQPDYGSSTPLDTLPSSAAEHSTQHPKVKEERLEPPPPGTEAMGPLPRPLSLTDLQGCENRCVIYCKVNLICVLSLSLALFVCHNVCLCLSLSLSFPRPLFSCP